MKSGLLLKSLILLPFRRVAYFLDEMKSVMVLAMKSIIRLDKPG